MAVRNDKSAGELRQSAPGWESRVMGLNGGKREDAMCRFCNRLHPVWNEGGVGFDGVVLAAH